MVWDELLARTGAGVPGSSVTFVVMLTIACLLAAVGVVTNSPVTVVGAMVLGPEFGPLAALAVGAGSPGRPDGAGGGGRARGRLRRSPWRSPRSAAAGAEAIGADPRGRADRTSPGWTFVYQVGPFSLVVALLAGVAGMVALIAGESTGVLVGVFISVTTVPAAGFAAVAAVLGDWRAGGGLAVPAGRQRGRDRDRRVVVLVLVRARAGAAGSPNPSRGARGPVDSSG